MKLKKKVWKKIQLEEKDLVEKKRKKLNWTVKRRNIEKFYWKKIELKTKLNR